VSVLIPTNSIGLWLRQAIDSIEKSDSILEILIIADRMNLTDQEKFELSSWNQKIRVIENRRGPYGVAESLNLGLASARGEYIARLDSDDLWNEGRVSAQIEALEKGYDLVFSRVKFKENERLIYKSQLFYLSRLKLELIIANQLFHPSVMFRRSKIMELGGYRCVGAEDYDLWLRCASNGLRMTFLKAKWTTYRLHENRLSEKLIRGL